jgi:peroxiredoxin
MIPLSIQLAWNAPVIFTLVVLGLGYAIHFLKPSYAAVGAVAASLAGSVWFSAYAVEHLPFRDFRPYAVGKNLPEQMSLPENAKPPIYENILVYKNTETGESKEFTTKEYTASKIWEDKKWEWVSTDSELIEEGDVAKITDFSILTHDDRDITDEVLSTPKVLLIVAYDLSLTSLEYIAQINDLSKAANSKGIKVMGLSSAGSEQKDKFIKANELNFDFFISDGIVLKTIVRSNPGVVYLENGTVKGKWHENDILLIEDFSTL